ncbi:hypothetical protein M9H77_08527 [Catharanthus roseus]|uniref:Uncharacterized protein n=1 Tax=Catharanthus roseus TaxID=4058 RepID=A0ACC0BY97_CATRO|nr:hypothetical protein M9H77_08527 [Catharanthus roseus]
MEEEGRSRLGEVKRVMVAIDESDRSLDALEWTLKFLGHSIANFEIVVFTAQPSSAFDYVSAFESSLELKNNVEEHQKKTANSVLEKARDICTKYKVIPKTVTEVQDPKDAIREAVDKYNIQLLVVGSHGRGAIKRAFLGSVSNYCVHNVKCPVLVVKQQQQHA